MTASGIHIAFFDAGEAASKELPAIGPLEGVLLRGDRLVVDRADVGVPDEPGIAVTLWLEGVVELQRATGETPGGRRRASMRLSAPDGLYLRFGSVGEPAASLRELGPFPRVFIGPRTIEANGDVLASRPSPGGGMWTLTANADASVGAQRPDVGFRTASQPYHAWMTPLPAQPVAAEPTPTAAPPPAPSQRVLKDTDIDLLERRARRLKEEEARAEERARQLDAALAEADARATSRDLEAAAAREATAAREAAAAHEAAQRETAAREAASARAAAVARAAATAREIAAARQAAAARNAPPAVESKAARGSGGKRESAAAKQTAKRESASSRRIAAILSSTPDVQAAEAGAGNWLELAWRLRFVLVATLVAVLGALVFNATQQGSTTAGPQERTFNLGQKITGTRWEYVINGITREPLAGTVRARGIYLVVRMTVTNKGGESAQAFPSDIALVDAAGTRYAAESLQSGVYASPDNRSPFEWPTSYPPGRPVTTRVVFDIDASLRGLQVVITEIPGTKVRIE